jgi:tRNA(Ile)-lysidine synthase
MKTQIQSFINEKSLFTIDDKLLVAVSGGVDSVVLSYLLNSCGYKIVIAHCNFQLRGEASDGDQIFVETLSKDLGVVCHSKRFDTEGYVLEKKLNTQLAARELRYQWFEELRHEFGYKYIVTAHHASDNIETVLYNFTKGTGLRGLTGMKPKNNAIVRPLLWAKKEEIQTFAEVQNYAFREDASNESDKYTRNYIRHHIVPALQHINPSFETTAIDNLKHLAETQILFDFFIKKIKMDAIEWEYKQFFIDKNEIKAYPSVATILFEILKDYGFNATQVAQILQDDEHRTGSLFYSQTYKLLIDRHHYIVAPIHEQTIGKEYFTILKEDTLLGNNHTELSFHYSDTISPIFPHDPHIACLDAEKLTFPLVLRKWIEGDRFQPLGMAGKNQLLSDFFRLKKLSQFEKEEVWVLETAENEICWVVGYRIDERFKITDDVKTCVTITASQNMFLDSHSFQNTL